LLILLGYPREESYHPPGDRLPRGVYEFTWSLVLGLVYGDNFPFAAVHQVENIVFTFLDFSDGFFFATR
jgi:hypothetical protein